MQSKAKIEHVRRVNMGILRKILPLIASIISIIMIFVTENDSSLDYPQEFKSVYFTLILFSLFYLYIQMKKVRFPPENWKYKLIASLCSFWLFVNQFYIWLCTNIWSVEYNVYSVYLIATFAVFVLAYFQYVYFEKMNYTFQKIIGIMASILLIAGGIWSFVWNYYDQAVICVCTLLLNLTDLISVNSDRITVENGVNKE